MVQTPGPSSSARPHRRTRAPTLLTRTPPRTIGRAVHRGCLTAARGHAQCAEASIRLDYLVPEQHSSRLRRGDGFPPCQARSRRAPPGQCHPPTPRAAAAATRMSPRLREICCPKPKLLAHVRFAPHPTPPTPTPPTPPCMRTYSQVARHTPLTIAWAKISKMKSS